MTFEGDVASLAALQGDPSFASLDAPPPLSLFSLLGVERHELAHSRLLAALADPSRHARAEDVVRVIVAETAAKLAIAGLPIAGTVRAIANSPWQRIRVHRELARIDVLIDITSSQGNLALGIENKIDAGEQVQQIARYQRAIALAYPSHCVAMAFLCPTTRASRTADDASTVPWVALGYDTILRAVSKALEGTPRNDRAAQALEQIIRHIKEELLNDDDVRRAARNLWKTHRRALELAIDHRPRLADMRASYEHALRERLPDPIAFEHYPERGDVREIKMHIPAWVKRGFPLGFMLYASDGEPPHVRVLIWKDAFKPRAKALQAWARRVNENGGPGLDPSFTPLPNWSGWHRVFAEDGYPTSAELTARDFDQETVEEAVQRVTTLVETLRPLVG